MNNNKKETISYNDYKEIESKIDSLASEEELIEIHKGLIGKTSNNFFEITDCGVSFVENLLSRDWGRSIVYLYSEGAQNFIKSKYLSDYFKESIKELLSSKQLSKKLSNALNSDKAINDMSESEIRMIHSSIKDFYKKSKNEEITNVASSFMTYLYQLDGKGVISYIKKNVNCYDLANHILLTSGLSDRASYYSGRGVNRGDLNEKNLTSIFKKLLKLDPNSAIEFAEMVKQMKTLGATEFINSFKNFAYNGFKVENINPEESNISVDGLHDEARDVVAFLSIYSTLRRGDDTEYQMAASEGIKHSFISTIRPVLDVIKPDFTYEYKGHSYMRKR